MARSVVPTSASAASSRVRNKKLSYKQKLCIQRGSHLLNAATLVVAGPEPEFEGQEHSNDANLGVDSSEISEHHLQAALSSNQLGATDNRATGDASSKVAYNIPTPDAKGVLSAKEFSELYPSGVYQDPITYIRFSDTVSDSIRGPSYCMDEDDEDWLDTRNSKARQDLALALKNVKSVSTNPNGIGKGKAKEKLREEVASKLIHENQAMLRVMTEDQFEMIMSVFEKATSEKLPFLHLDVTKIPTLDELLPSFDPHSSFASLAQPDLPLLPWEQPAASSSSSASNPNSATNGRRQSTTTNVSQDPTEWSPLNPYKNLSNLKALAVVVYPYWKSKRDDRLGKPVVPYLNFDETNDSDPYVCFRRREVKQLRKTRKTDALHIEKMVRLRTELEHAVALVQLVAQREKTKRASLQQSRQCWESVKCLLDIKRQWGILGPQQGLEDEELISGERRESKDGQAIAKKKRKAEDSAAALKLQNRKSRPSEGDMAPASVAANATVAIASGVHGMGSAILERVHAVQAYIERECLRKAEADLGWEEGSDSAFQPVPAAAALRAFRPIHSDASEENSPFAPLQSRVGRPPSFRRRVGRGGRVFLDRRLPMPSPVPCNLSDWPRASGAETKQRSTATSQGLGRQTKPGTLPSSDSQTNQPTLTGPFAFTPDLRPSLLAATTHPLLLHRRSSSELGGGGGPFATSNTPDSHNSDALSTSSDSTDRSRSSDVSTQATEIDDIEMLGFDGDHEKREQDDETCDWERSEDDPDRWSRLEERWRYDDESGRWAGLGLTGLGGMEDDDEAVLDDFDQRFIKYRMNLLEEADLLKLSTDLTNLQQAQAAAEAPPAKPAGYVHQPSTSAASAGAVSVSSATPVSRPTISVGVTGLPAGATPLQLSSAARTATVSGGGSSQTALAVQQLQAQQQQLQLTQQPSVQTQASVAAQPQQHQFGAQIPVLPHANLQQAQLSAVAAAAAAAQQQAQMQSQQIQSQQQHRVASPNPNNQQQRRTSGVGIQQQSQQINMPLQMQLPIQMQMQMQMAAASAQNQPHPLSQSMSFDASGMQAQLPRSLPPQTMPHSSPLQASAFAVPSAQFNTVMTGTAGSPPMQPAHIAAQAQAANRTSTSPASANLGVQNGTRPNPSPIMHASVAIPQQMQQRQGVGGGPTVNGVQIKAQQQQNNFLTLQTLQQVQQAQQFLSQNGQGTNPQQSASTAAQLMAMKAALAQNANLQLRLPPNRALQIAQQAAQAALGHGQQQQQQQMQQQQQQQQQAQGMSMHGNGSNQASPSLSRASTAGSPRMANSANGIVGGTPSSLSPSPQIGHANRANVGIKQQTNMATHQGMSPQGQMQFQASPVAGNAGQHQLKTGGGIPAHHGIANSPNVGHAQPPPQHATTTSHMG